MAEQGIEIKREKANTLSPRELVFKYLHYLPWLIISLSLMLILAKIQLRYSTPIYNVYGKLLVSPRAAGGGQEKFDDIGGHYSAFKFMGATDEEIMKIKACDGVIGIVGENYWLTGNDNHTSSTKTRHYKDGIKYIVETIKHIYSVTKSYETISIGSDFDGFANAPRDFKNPRYFKNLVEALKKENMTDKDINAITHQNALRVLEMGWGNPA